MKINILRVKRKTYIADLRDLPGSPPIGDGPNPETAVACLFFRILHPDSQIRHLLDSVDWTTFEVQHSKLDASKKIPGDVLVKQA